MDYKHTPKTDQEYRVHPTPYRFMPALQRMEPLILDHTAIIAAKQCLRKYFFQIVTGHTQRGPTPMYFAFGSAYHKFREVLDEEYMKGNTTTELKLALTAAVDYFAKATGGKNPPVGDKFDFLTQERLIQSCGVAYKHWQKEKAQKKIEILAVEQPFNVPVGDTSEFTSGRFDQIVRWNGKVWGRDFKTSSKEGMFYQRGLDPNDQFTRYTYAEQKLAGVRVEGQIIEVLYNSRKAGPTITTYLSSRTQWQLDDWEKDELFTRKVLDMCREEDRWPKHENSCPFCPFHSVCKMGSEGSQVAKLKAEFTQKAWNNMTIHLVD